MSHENAPGGDGTSLARLSERVGIETSYWDVFGGYHATSDETRRKFLAAMGYPAHDEDAANASLTMIEERPWRRMLEPVTIWRTTDVADPRTADAAILVVLYDSNGEQPLRWHVALEDGGRREGETNVVDLPVVGRRACADETCRRVPVALPDDLPHGYHRVVVRHGRSEGEATLIVTPPCAYRPDWLIESSKRVWGVACQLYALRSPTNWGMGDFSDLAALCAKTARHGGDAIGLPPLHALFPTRPELVSPYSPSSRLYLNPLYIDVTVVAEYAECAEARALVQSPGVAARLEAVRATDAVAFEQVADLKRAVLNALFAHFEKNHPTGSDSNRRKDFESFVAEGGEQLYRFALFEALQDHCAAQAIDDWAAIYGDPQSPQTLAFAHDHHDRVRFHSYLQWEADRQLATAAQTCAETGMAIGLYRDLAVGVAPGGADAWADPEAFLDGVRFGAPPDPLGPAGQDWGMPPFNPQYLHEHAYGPYIDMLRTNMRHAGALRIDHVMWLQHMFWIPPGGDGRDGAYVTYPYEDLLAILALESHRNRCVVIGEALGTVPEGFRERLTAEGILSYCLLQFERYPDGLYKRPDAYPPSALATPASHDLPTLAGFWRETDIEVQASIGSTPLSEEEKAERCTARARDREMLISALSDQNLLPADFPNTPDISDADLEALIAATHLFLARSPAALMMINLEDILLSTAQVNVPGTIDEYPNWRLKLAFELKQICETGGLAKIASRLNTERAVTS